MLSAAASNPEQPCLLPDDEMSKASSVAVQDGGSAGWAPFLCGAGRWWLLLNGCSGMWKLTLGSLLARKGRTRRDESAAHTQLLAL
jgi:hypothetical protein